jgi:rSAM-associated Gly-rich repeat protein
MPVRPSQVGVAPGLGRRRAAGEEAELSLSQKYLKVLAQLAASSAFGAAVMLGSAATASADQEPTVRLPSAAEQNGVAERLAAIRDAVSTVNSTAAAGQRLAWGNWWGNGGWRRPGWGNGGWGNGGWGNWRNGWPNWHNFWHNF